MVDYSSIFKAIFKAMDRVSTAEHKALVEELVDAVVNEYFAAEDIEELKRVMNGLVEGRPEAVKKLAPFFTGEYALLISHLAEGKTDVDGFINMLSYPCVRKYYDITLAPSFSNGERLGLLLKYLHKSGFMFVQATRIGVGYAICLRVQR